MSDQSANGLPIEGQRLTSWKILPGGEHIRLEISAADGTAHSVVLPFDALSSLLMTLPRMLQAALDARCSSGSLRVAQILGKWRLEQAAGETDLILKLATPDGFEVTFAVNSNVAALLGTALVTSASAAEPVPTTHLH
jgi:hypothetical protein